jgi:predicted permease
MIGGVLGFIVAQWGARLLAHYIPGYGHTVLLDLSVDLHILAFAFAISALAGGLFGVIPAWRGSRLDLATTLKDQTRGASHESGQLWHKVLVTSQIAVSCCLLVGAGLFVRTVQKFKSLDTGLDREDLIAFQLDLGRGYDRARRANLHRDILHRLEALPGVRSACCSSIQSLGGGEVGWGPNKIVPLGGVPNADEGMPVRGTGVTLDYFATMGIPLLRGRDFSRQDESIVSGDQPGQAPRPVIIDETIARGLFGQEDPVGKLLRPDGSGSPLEVIGIAKDAIHKGLRDGPRPSVYSLASSSHMDALGFFYVRSLGNPSAVTGGIRQVVRDLDSKIEVVKLRTMREMFNDQLFREQSLSSLTGFFSLLALVLACLGLYGTLSYGVVRRTREIGVRIALGAQRRDVLSLVIREGLKLALVGIGIGLGAALAVTRLVSSLLYGITAADPATFIAVSLLLVGVSALACWLPARRAAKADPMEALRYE